MNLITIIGRIVRDPEIKHSNGAQPVAYGNYTIACDRPKRNDAEAVTDFIYCKVVGKTAEFAEKFLKKGMKIAINGRMQVDSYEDNDGNKKSTTYVLVTNHEFCESKSSGSGESRPAPARKTDEDGYMDIPEGEWEQLPFN